jgi:hypothetical protein
MIKLASKTRQGSELSSNFEHVHDATSLLRMALAYVACYPPLKESAACANALG